MSIYRGRTRREFYLTSSLYDSIEDNNLNAVELLFKKGADPNIVLPRVGIAPFHLIIGNNDETFAIAVTKLILQNGGNPNVQSDDGLTPLHISAAWGRFEMTELLLHCGGDPCIQDRNGFTPLDYAIKYNYSAIVELLNEFIFTSHSVVWNEDDDCSLRFDRNLVKVLINNGYEIGEYIVSDNNEFVKNNLNSDNVLDRLPGYRTNEFLNVWFTEHLRKMSLSSESSTKKDSEDHCSIGSTFSDDSDKLISNRQISFSNVNCRPRYKSNDTQEDNNSNEFLIKFPSLSYPNKNSYEKDNFCKLFENTRESGIVTLPEESNVEYFTENSNCNRNEETKVRVQSLTTLNENERKNGNEKRDYLAKVVGKDSSSDYFSCNDISSNINPLERNIFEISSEISNSCSNIQQPSSLPSETTNFACHVLESDETFISVSEIYKYTDKEDGIVLYEKHLKGNTSTESSERGTSMATTISSKLSSLPATIDYDYDTDQLRKELQCSGYNPGPITVTTKRLYLKKLLRLKNGQQTTLSLSFEQKEKVFSSELEKTICCQNWYEDLSSYKLLDESVSSQFSCTDYRRNWREGTSKSSFTYLLLDPRLTNNLPARSDYLSKQELWKTFLSSIFYVGKGKRSRPHQHLYDAARQWNSGNFCSSTNEKIQRIMDIWKANKGVVCLLLFQNIIPAEAYTREAAMISALGLDNLVNVKGGDFYGVAAAWSARNKQMYGVYLLYKAMRIFLHEGERQLSPKDIE